MLLLDIEIADRLSDAIVQASNVELDGMRAGLRPPGAVAITLLTGHLLGLMAVLRTAPHPRPTTLQHVEDAVVACLDDIGIVANVPRLRPTDEVS